MSEQFYGAWIVLVSLTVGAVLTTSLPPSERDNLIGFLLVILIIGAIGAWGLERWTAWNRGNEMMSTQFYQDDQGLGLDMDTIVAELGDVRGRDRVKSIKSYFRYMPPKISEQQALAVLDGLSSRESLDALMIIVTKLDRSQSMQAVMAKFTRQDRAKAIKIINDSGH